LPTQRLLKPEAHAIGDETELAPAEHGELQRWSSDSYETDAAPARPPTGQVLMPPSAGTKRRPEASSAGAEAPLGLGGSKRRCGVATPALSYDRAGSDGGWHVGRSWSDLVPGKLWNSLVRLAIATFVGLLAPDSAR
jgi:hypothetical protein